MYFVETVKAYEKVWMIGDEFMTGTYAQYFQNAFGDNGKVGYIRAHYDATAFYKGDGLNPNYIARIRNAIAYGMNDQVVLPKAIILIFENNLINEINHKKPGISTLMGRLIEWLANQIHRMIVSHKERLPSKARKFKYPTVLWVLLPDHYDQGEQMQEYRNKFNTCVTDTVSLFREMETLKLDIDDCDRSLMTKNKWNARGLTVYYYALNSAFEVWDKDQMKLMHIKDGASMTSSSWGEQKNKVRFKESSFLRKKYSWNPANTRFKLPKPEKTPGKKSLVPYQ